MRIRYLLAAVIFLSLVSCATVSNEQADGKGNEDEFTNDDIELFEGLLYYTFADISREMGDYFSASEFLSEAVKRNPESVFLTQQLLENKAILTSTGRLPEEELLELGNNILKTGTYNIQMMSILGRYFTQKSNQKEAEKYFSAGLQLQADKEFYYSYYVYLKRFSLPEASIYLEKVAEEPWQDEDANLIYKAGVEYSRSFNVTKGIKLLLKGYLRWDSEQFVRSINWPVIGYIDDEIKELMLELEAEEKLTREMLEVLLANYAKEEKYASILSLENACRRFGDEYSLRMLYSAALYENNYPLVFEIGELLLLEKVLPEKAEQAVLSSFTVISYGEGDWEKAGEYFKRIDHCVMQYACLNAMIIEYPSLEMVRSFLEQQYKISEGAYKDRLLLFLALHNHDDHQKLDEILSLLPLETFDDVLCVRLVAHTLNEPASETIEAIKEKYIEYFSQDHGLSGLFHYFLEEEEIALERFREQASQGDLSMNEFMVYHEILSERPAGDELLQMLKDAAKTFSDSSVVLNLYGYSAADYQWEDEYNAAEEAILKALEIEPDNSAYWDSLGWLYYRMGKYPEALEAMQNTMADAEKHDVILYHNGMILSVNGRYAEAKGFLEKVISKSNDEELIEKTNETLKVIEKINQEDK